jgi:hypothetical protein
MADAGRAAVAANYSFDRFKAIVARTVGRALHPPTVDAAAAGNSFEDEELVPIA